MRAAKLELSTQRKWHANPSETSSEQLHANPRQFHRINVRITLTLVSRQKPTCFIDGDVRNDQMLYSGAASVGCQEHILASGEVWPQDQIVLTRADVGDFGRISTLTGFYDIASRTYIARVQIFQLARKKKQMTQFRVRCERSISSVSR
ncbi:hypothetical protein F2P81_020132 [Scophthalmus maximus]|uniref:Uncharacterized protein n=1 Tax=Scophthalmus maximus TaxID=52904 RepID=A0A6A4S8H4_SCOMX|nr:hypothetical protein F2P81_020132 [Scophthalmus maximus]